MQQLLCVPATEITRQGIELQGVGTCPHWVKSDRWLIAPSWWVWVLLHICHRAFSGFMESSYKGFGQAAIESDQNGMVETVGEPPSEAIKCLICAAVNLLLHRSTEVHWHSAPQLITANFGHHQSYLVLNQQPSLVEIHISLIICPVCILWHQKSAFWLCLCTFKETNATMHEG